MKPSDLVGLTEIAEMLGLSGSSVVSNWRKRHADFPQPWGQWHFGSLFVRSEVKNWYADHLAKQVAANERERAKLERLLARNKEAAKALDNG